MPEDKLTHRQRVRLESLAQALHTPFENVPSLQDIFQVAEQIETWLLQADREIN